jgi:hypothetical protein
MFDLGCQAVGAEPERFAAAPRFLFKLHITAGQPDGTPPVPIQSILLRCQIGIEPARRRYSATEEGRLVDEEGAAP